MSSEKVNLGALEFRLPSVGSRFEDVDRAGVETDRVGGLRLLRVTALEISRATSIGSRRL